VRARKHELRSRSFVPRSTREGRKRKGPAREGGGAARGGTDGGRPGVLGVQVENLPHATFLGRDAQLERAVAEVLRALEQDPVTRPDGEPTRPFPAPARGVGGGGRQGPGLPSPSPPGASRVR
jgi:hypothetical protein